MGWSSVAIAIDNIQNVQRALPRDFRLNFSMIIDIIDTSIFSMVRFNYIALAACNATQIGFASPRPAPPRQTSNREVGVPPGSVYKIAQPRRRREERPLGRQTVPLDPPLQHHREQGPHIPRPDHGRRIPPFSRSSPARSLDLWAASILHTNCVLSAIKLRLCRNKELSVDRNA